MILVGDLLVVGRVPDPWSPCPRGPRFEAPENLTGPVLAAELPLSCKWWAQAVVFLSSDRIRDKNNTCCNVWPDPRLLLLIHHIQRQSDNGFYCRDHTAT